MTVDEKDNARGDSNFKPYLKHNKDHFRAVPLEKLWGGAGGQDPIQLKIGAQ